MRKPSFLISSRCATQIGVIGPEQAAYLPRYEDSLSTTTKEARLSIYKLRFQVSIIVIPQTTMRYIGAVQCEDTNETFPVALLMIIIPQATKTTLIDISWYNMVSRA